MAKLVLINPPTNGSEAFAARFLKDALPDDYEVYGFFDIYMESGQPLECDLAVIGEWAVYFVEVKGYDGRVEIGKDVCLVNGAEKPNPLPQANKLARVFSSRLRAKTPPGRHAAWCQGMGFMTGNDGEGINLHRQQRDLPVWTVTGIVEALASPDYVTAQYKNRLTAEQRSRARDLVGQVALVEERNRRIGDFKKLKKLARTGAMEVWTAELRHESVAIPYILKILDCTALTSGATRKAARAPLLDEYRLLQELVGVSGVPYVAPLIDDGEKLALAIRRPRGRPLSEIDPAGLSAEQRVAGALSACVALDGIRARGLAHGNLNANSLILTNGMEVELLDLMPAGNRASPWRAPELAESTCPANAASDVFSLAALLSPWFARQPHAAQSTDDLLSKKWAFDLADEFENRWPGLQDWFAEALSAAPEQRPALIELRAALHEQAEREPPVTEMTEFIARPGAVINDTYDLVEELGHSEYATVWKARHRVGRFDCVLRIADDADYALPAVQKEFEILARLYHPNVARAFEIDRIDGSDAYYMCLAWAPGESLDRHVQGKRLQGSQCVALLRKLLTALDYLHRSRVTHRNISPNAIVVNGEDPVLIDFSALPDALRRTGNVTYKDPGVLKHGWDARADLYALAMVFVEACTAVSPSRLQSDDVDVETLRWPKELPARTREALLEMASAAEDRTTPNDYLAYFGLEERDTTLTELPRDFRENWGLSSGYQDFLAVDMLNDRRARNRNQWVLNALRTRKIAGNRTNRSSFSAAMSALLKKGVAEKHRTKIRLTEEFLADWDRHAARL